MNTEYFYETGKMPDRYYYQLNKDPHRAYRKQTRKAKDRRQEMTFAEKFFIDLAEAELYAILMKARDDVIDQLNGK